MARLTCALGPDSAGDVILRALREATTSIDAAIYEIGDAYTWAFAEAARRGVTVRLVVDPRSDPLMRSRAVSLNRSGVDCRLLSQPGSYLHSKLIVIDDGRVAVGSGNLNGRDLPFPHGSVQGPLAGTREWWMVVEGAPTLAKTARAHVLRNWRIASPAIGVAEGEIDIAAPPVHAVTPAVPALEVELTPRRIRFAGGGAGVRTLEMELLSGVRHRAYVIVPYVSAAAPAVAELLGALTTHARRGLDARLLLGQPPTSQSDIVALAHLEAPVRVMDSAVTAGETTGHAKGLVCDDAVVAGSANWSEAGLTGNDEAALTIAHPLVATYFAEAFVRDWELAVPLSEVPVSG